jgi:hypothetical protein
MSLPNEERCKQSTHELTFPSNDNSQAPPSVRSLKSRKCDSHPNLLCLHNLSIYIHSYSVM